jgi:hypothetical protein
MKRQGRFVVRWAAAGVILPLASELLTEVAARMHAWDAVLVLALMTRLVWPMSLGLVAFAGASVTEVLGAKAFLLACNVLLYAGIGMMIGRLRSRKASE